MEQAKPTISYDKIGPWNETYEYDQVIAKFLKKKVIKEITSSLPVYFFGLITFVLFLVYEAMIKENLIASIIFFIIDCLILSVIYDTFGTLRKKQKQIEKREYKTCTVYAYEISDKYNDKYCLVKDASDNILTEVTTDSKEVPTKLTYYSYFSVKETQGLLVVLPSLALKKDEYKIVLPISYLEFEEKNVRK